MRPFFSLFFTKEDQISNFIDNNLLRGRNTVFTSKHPGIIKLSRRFMELYDFLIGFEAFAMSLAVGYNLYCDSKLAIRKINSP